jgi:uncharacterized glyoxalase superfamily protein PhnB
MSVNRSMPPGVIIPEIPYTNITEAADWLCGAFGFKKRLQIGNHRIQLTFGDGSMVAIEGNGSDGYCAVMVHVEDLDDHYQRAIAAGARVINPPADYLFGERQYTAEDIGGHRWIFSQTMADVDPASWGGTLFA